MRNPTVARSGTLIVALGVLGALIFHGYSAGFIAICADDFSKTVLAARGLAVPSVWFRDVWLPLHLILIAIAGALTNDMLLGSRLVSIAFGMLLVAAMCGIGHQLGGKKGAALAAILGATHPMVVLCSSSALVDICYVATFMLGLRFYLRATVPERPSRLFFLVACALFTLACAFHYNAWIADLLLVPFLCRDLYRAHLGRRVVVVGILVLGAVPLAWVTWNWAESGDPLAFFTKHSSYSKAVWESAGWHASTLAAFGLIKDSILVYSPLVALLAFAAIGTTFSRRSTAVNLLVPWSILLGFLAVILFLFANGGRPTAFEPRYILLPSVLMIAIASASLARVCSAGNREARAFVLSLAIAAIFVNIRLYDRAIEFTRCQVHYAYTVEARDVASVMRRRLRANNLARMMIEVKSWNFLVLPVFLNRVDAVVSDRVPTSDPGRPFDSPSVFMGEKEAVLARLRAQNVDYVAVYSQPIRSHIEPWGLEHVATVDTYTIYRLPREGIRLGVLPKKHGVTSR